MTRDIAVSDSATPEEAAAIAASIGAYLDAERDEAVSDDAHKKGDAWQGDRWRFRGRIEALGSRSVRVPDGAPTDPWRAVERADRF